MDIREFLQALVGAVILKPDELLLGSSQQSSSMLAEIDRVLGMDGSVSAFSLLHTFVLVVGLGLLMGIDATTSLFIAIFVVLGVAGGLFAVGALFSVLGINLDSVTNGIAGALSPAFSHSLLADGFVVFPFVLLAAGVARYRWGSVRRATKQAQATYDSLRHYCAFCGSVMKPGSRRCQACREGIPKTSKMRCTNCGRFVPKGARFCWVCGEELLWSGPQSCPECGRMMGAGAKFCPECGTRQPAGANADAPPDPTESEEP